MQFEGYFIKSYYCCYLLTHGVSSRVYHGTLTIIYPWYMDPPMWLASRFANALKITKFDKLKES